MTTLDDLKDFFQKQDFKVIVVGDAEPRVHQFAGETVVQTVPAGGVAIALEPIAKASEALYIARGRTEADRRMSGRNNTIEISDAADSYRLKRVFLTPDELNLYYNGFSNQTVWPLCHVAFERPDFSREWYEGYKAVNKRFADAVKEEIKGKTFIWVNDYQMSLVPKFLGRPRNTIIGMFWHIPWPTWEVFRILPEKREVLESLLYCDYLAFHRGYHVRNFLRTVEREFEARVDDETNKVYYNNKVTTVNNLPLGLDTDVIKTLIINQEPERLASKIVKNIFGIKNNHQEESKNEYDKLFHKNKVIIGVDRLDYTKGIILRLQALDRFFEKNPRYHGKVVYLGVLSPSRETVPAYVNLKREIEEHSKEINRKHKKDNWKPIHLIYQTFSREEVVNFYNRADLCLVTPRDDGMNLVSKEFVISTSFANNPGMLILSQFAGSAIDLTESLIVNPYDIEEVADAIKKGLEMDTREKRKKINTMVETLEEKNAYEWARDFVKNAITAARENRG